MTFRGFILLCIAVWAFPNHPWIFCMAVLGLACGNARS
jgi:hypothetical protein